jgi:peroxiredoxin
MKTLIMFILAGLAFVNPARAGEGIVVGAPPPIFTLLDEENRSTDIGALMDRPTIIYFTHNSCFYCTQIVAYLKRAEKEFGRDRLRIMGVNIMARDKKLIQAYKQALGFTFPMFAGNREDVLRAYRINYVPVIVFVDSRKIVRKVVGHYIHEQELHDVIRGILQ